MVIFFCNIFLNKIDKKFNNIVEKIEDVGKK